MNKRIHQFSVLIALLVVSAAGAQVSPDEAAAKLRERDAARRAAATQPSQLTNAQVAELNQRIATLTAENQKLKSQVDDLAAKLARATAAPTAPMGIAQAITEHRLVNGMTIEQANEALSVKFVKMSASSDGEVYSAIANRKQERIGSVKGIPTGGDITGTEYTIEVKDGVVTYWSSKPYSASPGAFISPQPLPARDPHEKH